MITRAREKRIARAKAEKESSSSGSSTSKFEKSELSSEEDDDSVVVTGAQSDHESQHFTHSVKRRRGKQPDYQVTHSKGALDDNMAIDLTGFSDGKIKEKQGDDKPLIQSYNTLETAIDISESSPAPIERGRSSTKKSKPREATSSSSASRSKSRVFKHEKKPKKERTAHLLGQIMIKAMETISQSDRESNTALINAVRELGRNQSSPAPPVSSGISQEMLEQKMAGLQADLGSKLDQLFAAMSSNSRQKE